jgi:hypothetical protein
VIRSSRPRWPIVLPACALFALHAAQFGAWQIDDAGISFAYARNLALGHGLVAQPGVIPVEGYSNPLWVFLLATFSVVRLFDPLWTPKLLSFAFAFGTFALLDRLLARSGVGTALSALALGLLAVQSSFAIWMVSGLENPLYVCLFVGLVLLSLRAIQKVASPRVAIAAGLIASGLALTRPEGILFAALFPLAVGLAPERRFRRWVPYLAAFALPVALYLAVRLAWFGVWVPNTFYAKGGPTLATLTGLAALDPFPANRALTLLRAAFGKPGAWVGLAMLLALGYLLGRGKLRRETLLLVLATLFSALPYLLLPLDWMPEYRFATPFFPLVMILLAKIASDLWPIDAGETPAVPGRAHPTSEGDGRLTVQETAHPRNDDRSTTPGTLAGLALRVCSSWDRRRLAGILLSVALVASVLTSNLPRTRRFAAKPTVPFSTVEQRYGHDYNHFADQLQLRQGSILLPDVGGTLWRSRLTVYDLGGLCNPTIARTLGKNDRAFHDYVFETLRPTFIHIHHYWTVRAKLDSDPRFARDYLPLYEEVEPYAAARTKGQTLRSGDFVRKEVAAGHPKEIASIRTALVASYALERGSDGN